MKKDTETGRNGNTEMKKTNDMSQTACRRSDIYGLLALIYRSEVTKALLRRLKNPAFLSALSDMGAKPDDVFLKRPEDEFIDDLAAEYTRLFIGPGKHISPHESVHHERDDGDWGALWGSDTVVVKKFIETAGLQYKPEYAGLPDHISVEFEFMQRAAWHEAQALKENDNNGALYCLRMEKKFIDEHLIKWIPVFCDKVISEAQVSFYREMAMITRNFVELEKEEIDKYILEVG